MPTVHRDWGRTLRLSRMRICWLRLRLERRLKLKVTQQPLVVVVIY